MKAVCDFYKQDFNIDTICTQLQTLQVHFLKAHGTVQDLNILFLKDYLCTLSNGELALLSQIKTLTQLILLMPAANASPERSFSALRRVKTYLRTSMTQQRLNLMLLHVHKEKTDSLDLKSILNEFIESTVADPGFSKGGVHVFRKSRCGREAPARFWPRPFLMGGTPNLGCGLLLASSDIDLLQ